MAILLCDPEKGNATNTSHVYTTAGNDLCVWLVTSTLPVGNDGYLLILSAQSSSTGEVQPLMRLFP